MSKDKHTVFLFYSPSCVRGWLAYFTMGDMTDIPATVEAEIESESRAKAKSKAITMMNKRLRGEPTEGFKIVKVNRRDPSTHEGFWSVEKYPALCDKQLMLDFETGPN